MMLEDPTVCESDEVYYEIEERRKMVVAGKLGKNKELKPQDKQTEVEDRKKGLIKREVESHTEI